MYNPGEGLSDLLRVDAALSIVTLPQLESRLSGLSALRCKHALVCIGVEGSGDDLALLILLEALAQTNAVTQHSNGLLCTRGDELICLLPGCSRAGALIFARMLRAAIQAPMRRRNRLQLGIGVVPINDASDSPQTLLKAAHNVCREALRRGHNRIEVHDRA